MYCKHCGKEISDTAFMCPDCGTPTETEYNKLKPDNKPADPGTGHSVALSVIGFILSTVGFITGIVFGALILSTRYLETILYIVSFIGFSTILPLLSGAALNVYGIINSRKSVSKILSIIGIALAGIAFLFLFIIACIFIA